MSSSIGYKFDVIVVGGGPAGMSCAYFLAKKGFKTLVIERGRRPGCKCVFGGRVYSYVLERRFGSIRELPIERWVTVEKLTIVDKGSLTVEFRGEPRRSFTTYLPSLVEHLRKLAESNGAMVVSEIPVERLLAKEGRIVGVVAGNDEVYSDVVVVAEGVNRLVLERSGLAPRLDKNDVALGVKEVIRLGREVINERFGLDDDEGLAWFLMGSPTERLPGGAFLYTNKDTVSLGVVLYLANAYELKTPIYELVEGLRLHSLVYNFVRDGELVEYAAHLTPISGPRTLRMKPYGDGYVIIGDAAGFVLHLGLIVRGVDYAIESAYLAAEAIEKAHSLGGFSRENLSVYERLIKEDPLFKDFKRFEKIHGLLMDKRLYDLYVDLIINALKRYFTVEERHDTPIGALKDACKSVRTSLLNLIKDALKLAFNV